MAGMGKLGRSMLRTGVGLAPLAFLCGPFGALAQQPSETGADVEAAPEGTTCELPSEPAEYVLPATGLVWTFPPDPAAAADCVPALPPPPVRPPAPDLFRMAALPVVKTSSLSKWEAARAVTLEGRSGAWTEMLDQANEVTGGDPLGMVNMWVNWHVRYQDDAGPDEWADALSTLQRGAGDCEDFAVTKMALLSALGIPSDDMFLVLLRDRGRMEHAVLAVRRGEEFYILDNRTDKLRPASEVADYTPILSFSGDFAWMYGTRTE